MNPPLLEITIANPFSQSLAECRLQKDWQGLLSWSLPIPRRVWSLIMRKGERFEETRANFAQSIRREGVRQGYSAR